GAAAGGRWCVGGNARGGVGSMGAGTPRGGEARQVAERLSFFEGLGAIRVLLAALALGRVLVVGVRESRRADLRRRAAEGRAADERVTDERAGGADDSEATAVPAQRKRGHFHLGRQKERHTTSRRG